MSVTRPLAQAEHDGWLAYAISLGCKMISKPFYFLSGAGAWAN